MPCNCKKDNSTNSLSRFALSARRHLNFRRDVDFLLIIAIWKIAECAHLFQRQMTRQCRPAPAVFLRCTAWYGWKKR